MKIITPITITDDMLLSSNLDDTTYDVWDATKMYIPGDYVQHEHIVYMATKGLNGDNYNEYSSTKEYIKDNYVKVTDKKRVYKSLQGDVLLGIDDYSLTTTYTDGIMCKSITLKKIFNATCGEILTNYTAYSSATSYAIGDYCYKTVTVAPGSSPTTYERATKIYKALKASSSTSPKDPETYSSGLNAYWSVVGIENKAVPPYALFYYTTTIEWSESTAYVTGNIVKVDADEKIYIATSNSTGKPPKDNLSGTGAVWAVLEKYDANITNGVWEVYTLLNMDHYPPDNISGTTPYWDEYGILNIGYPPSDYSEGDDDDYIYWTRVGTTNKWAMFDDYTNTYSTGMAITDGTEINFSVEIGGVDAISFFNVLGVTMSLSVVSDDGTILWTKEEVLTNNVSKTWFEFFFGGQTMHTPKDLFYILPKNLYGNILNVSIKSPGTCKLGMFKCGYSSFIGSTLYQPKIGIIDYSKKSTNDYGETSLSVGAYKKYTNIDLMVDPENVDSIFTKLASFRGSPLIIIADNSDSEVQFFQSMLLYGFLNDWYVTIEGPDYTVCTVEATGFI